MIDPICDGFSHHLLQHAVAMEDPLDLIIVGAGVYGICAASTYLQLHPDADIRVIDSGKDVGGVWSTDRLYPRFWSQTGVRLAGFPDAPFKPPEDAELYHDLPEARHLSKYLEDYVSQRGIREHCLLDTWVEGVEKQGNVWEVKAVRHGDSIVLKAKAIIVATGLSSLPQMPDLPGRDQFTGLVLHQKDFGRSKIFTAEERDPEHHRDVTIIGGSKSAAAIVYAAATDTHIERNVNWIIRSSGSGPLTFTPAKAFGKYKNLPETGSTRAIASLSIANPFLPANTWWSWFIHKTFIGNWLNSRLMSRTEAECAALANFDGRKDSLEGFEGLRSNSNVKWRVGPLGLMQRDDFGDVVARNMHVHRSDVKTLEERVVVLEDGKVVPTDVLLCGTGWRQEMPFLFARRSARTASPPPIALSVNRARLPQEACLQYTLPPLQPHRPHHRPLHRLSRPTTSPKQLPHSSRAVFIRHRRHQRKAQTASHLANGGDNRLRQCLE